MTKFLPYILFMLLTMSHWHGQYVGAAAIIAVPKHLEVHEPTLTKVAEIVEHVPTAVSHQSSTIVHSNEKRITPVLAAGMRSYAAPAIRTYTTAGDLAFPYHGSLLWPSAAAFVHAHAPTFYVAHNGGYGYATYPSYGLFGPADYRR